ncbi:hypothetical protein EYF80_053122 [Liparis tanakae]|uniref:Uncharacterized protein n=1 Tax=Liparis tanakae TaxID=230148 RepID=A0A4Z2F6B7_9TELE|nr:hypothetical protein EYF80_053122 [Liparis tanakae]
MSAIVTSTWERSHIPREGAVTTYFTVVVLQLHHPCMREGGMQQWRTHDLSHSSGGLCWSQYGRLERDMRRAGRAATSSNY